jgi:hypothetical protein
MPAKAGIQYPEPLQFKMNRRCLLDRRLRGDDDWVFVAVPPLTR